jgi:hypothetical protein
MDWLQPPRIVHPGVIRGRVLQTLGLPGEGEGFASVALPSANPVYQTFPEVPEKIGGGIGGNNGYELPSEEYMDIANNVALSKYYANQFMENWPLYLGGTAVVLYLVFRR